jgi:hypothetical protein
MADIKQAASWMQEGKQVARKSWAGTILPRRQSEGEHSIVCGRGSSVSFAHFYPSDLLADDWEVVGETG